MRFAPVAQTKEDYDANWYIAQGFGEPTEYGYHEGDDYNLKHEPGTSGDLDLNQIVYAIAPGRMRYYHKYTHRYTGYGMHSIYEIVGPWGVRWVHCAHLQEEGFVISPAVLVEGQQIGLLGKSGTQIAHLHFAIWKTDPAGKIDMVARNLTELHANWEDPVAFIARWYAPPAGVGDDSLYDFGQPFGVMRLVDAAQEMRWLSDKLIKIGEIVDAA